MEKKILVIRFSSIGDIVLTSPVVRCLKNQVENAEIHFVVSERFAGIVQSNPNIDKVHILGDSLDELIKKLMHEKFDYVIDLQHNFRSLLIKRKLKSPTFSLNKLNIEKKLLVWFKINRLRNVHIVDRYFETVTALNLANDGKGLDFFIPDHCRFDLQNLPGNFQNGYVAFVIAGTYTTKRLPVDKVTAICNGIPYPVVLLGGRSEFEAGEKVVENSKGNVLNLAGKISLKQSASLVQDAKIVLTNDTGLMHIAAAFHKKILSFWGNTVSDFGMVPYYPAPSSKRIEVEKLRCRPCSKLGFNKCPRGHFKCMKKIDVDLAVKWIEDNF